MTTFGIDRSLSEKGCPCENAVAEATFKIMKTEFTFDKSFEELEYSLFDYVIDTVIKHLHRVPSYDENISKNEQIYQTVFEISSTV